MKLVQPKAFPKFKVPSLGTKPRRRVKKVNLVLSGLPFVAYFLRSISPVGPPGVVIEKVSKSGCVYVIGQTLHVNVLQLCNRNELNFILLITYFGLVDEVRIHNFHFYYFLTSRRLHVRIEEAPWVTVKFILPFINRGPWELRDGKIEKAIKITFDDFLKPVVEAWRAGQPYTDIFFKIPEYEVDLITTYVNFLWVHMGIGTFVEGYSSESEEEVDYAFDTLSAGSDEECDIMIVCGYPFLLMSP